MLQPSRPVLGWFAPPAFDRSGLGARHSGGRFEITATEIRTACAAACSRLRAGLAKYLSRMTRLFARSPGRSEMRLH